MNTLSNRNGYLDFWKFIAAIGVILVHVPIPGIYGRIMNAVGVCGVGFFYLISGYACYGEDKKQMCRKIVRRFIKNGLITFIAIILYFVFSLVEQKITKGYYGWIRNFRNPSLYIRMLLLGDFEVIYGAALWFMIALLYCYLIFLPIVRFNLRKTVYILTPLLLILRIIVDSYVNSFPVSWHLSANVIIGALPMMLLGYLIAEQKEKLICIADWEIIAGAVISALCMFFAVNHKIHRIDISQPFKILTAAFIFLYGIKKPQAHICKPLEKLGREDSLFIYLCHFPVIIVLVDIYYRLPVRQKNLEWMLPFVVIIVSLILARALSLLIKGIKKVISIFRGNFLYQKSSPL